jgi:hypothetical protein
LNAAYRAIAIIVWLSAQHIMYFCIFIVWSWWGFSHHYTLFISFLWRLVGGGQIFLSHFSFLDPIIRVFLQDLVWLDGIHDGVRIGWAWYEKSSFSVSFRGIIFLCIGSDYIGLKSGARWLRGYYSDRYGIFLSGVENCELWCDVLVIVQLEV